MTARNDDDYTEEESFAELFEAYASGIKTNIRVGDKIKGEIISVGQDSVFVDTGTKIDGNVDKSELLEDDGTFPYQLGDMVTLYVVAMGENEIKLSRAIAGMGGLDLLKDAFAKAIPVEGTVQEICKGGLRVLVTQRRAFCPISQIDLQFVEDPGIYVGKTLLFLITDLDARGKNIVISRRKLLEIEQEKAIRSFLEQLKEGALLEGVVKKVLPYGAFIELVPGVEGMAHVSEMSWSRVENPQDVLQPGDSVSVKVIRIDQPEASKPPKIGLSLKQVSDDPWLTISKRFTPGETVEGKVTRCLTFGAFVEIAPGVEGLVHISEMSYVKRVVKPEEVVTKGESVHVLIKELNAPNRRISLSIRDAEGDPWIDVSERFPKGAVVSGTVARKEKFGCFVTLAPGIIGLLPKSIISRSPEAAFIDRAKPGDALTVRVAEIDTKARKIGLAPAEAGDAGDWHKFVRKEDTYLSPLGEKLKSALDLKKIGGDNLKAD